MLTEVEYLGPADKASLIVGGPSGPLHISPDPQDVAEVFLFRGYAPNSDPVEGVEDERVGQRLANLMAAVGNAGADSHYTVKESAQIMALLSPDVAHFMSRLNAGEYIDAAEESLGAITSRRLTLAQGASILGHLVAGAGGPSGVAAVAQQAVDAVRHLFS